MKHMSTKVKMEVSKYCQDLCGCGYRRSMDWIIGFLDTTQNYRQLQRYR
jgi:hypothetical protein